MLLQVYDGLLSKPTWTKSLLGKFLTLITQYTKEPRPDCSLHPCLANKVRFNCFSCLKSIPPQALGEHYFSQLIQPILRSSLHYPHQKFLIRLVILSQRDLGILKQLMVYVEMDCATTFIKTSFQALDSSFFFHPTSFLANFSFNSMKVFFLLHPTNDGRPKYFSCYLITYAPNLAFISSWTSCAILMLKNREVFVLFSCCPEDCS